MFGFRKTGARCYLLMKPHNSSNVSPAVPSCKNTSAASPAFITKQTEACCEVAISMNIFRANLFPK